MQVGAHVTSGMLDEAQTIEVRKGERESSSMSHVVRTSTSGLRGRNLLLRGWDRFFFQCIPYRGRQIFDSFDESSGCPQIIILVPSSVHEHAGAANAVLRNPKDLRFAVLGTYFVELRNGGKEGSAVVVGFSRIAVAS